MIPEFPQFKKLELTDKKDVEKFTSQFPPYSDFNFVSMWSWDIKGEMRISMLNNNFVVRFTDYITGEPFYSFLGNNKVSETAETLLKLSIKEGLEPKLKLVPEDLIKNIDTSRFLVEEDRDNFDYILDIKKVKNLKGDKYSNKRGIINNLLKKHKIEIKQMDNFSPIMYFLENLKDQKSKIKIEKEIEAIVRLLKLEIKLNLILLVAFSNDKIVGFVLNEVLLHNRSSIGHFLKVNSKFHPGLSTFLVKNMCEILDKEGFKSLNMEQDLGIPGLRFWKENYRPVNFLKKYDVFYK